MISRKPRTKYDYNRLKQYCEENNIVLTKDYSKEKINRETIIEANCLNCSGDVKKNYRQFVISGCFCETCTKQNARLIQRETQLKTGNATDYLKLILEKIDIYNCTDVSIHGKPIGECLSKEINREVDIEFTCNCGEKQSKPVRDFVELTSGDADGGRCRVCIVKKQQLKIRETQLKTGYASDYLKLILENISIYNCTDVSIHGKPIDECLNNEIHREVNIEFTCNCGEKQSKPVRSFVELGSSDADGGRCRICIINTQGLKMKETCLNRYGVECATQSQIVKDKTETTCMEKYGTKNPMHNTEIFDKQQKAGFKRKEYIFPSGRIDSVQGYEPQALDYFITNGGNEDDIITDTDKIESRCGKIFYHFEDGRHRYYPDLYQISTHKIIEVKSIWTFKSQKEKNLKKREACINAGINFEFWIMGKEGKLLEII
jgi:hypothetical protein